jgi:nitroimidazol reductase NimA-like FMN-containing flavoprotein (pyridoxamine 5'-phosphate oxidase superfamily)
MMTTEREATIRQDQPRSLTGHEPLALGPAGERLLRTLSPAECFALLEPGGVGRVGFTAAEGIMVLPVNFAVAGKAIVFRTAPDTLLALYADSQVSFEVDHLDEALREGWSVLVHGRAHKVTDERQVKHLEHGTRLQPWAAGARDVYVRITPAQISGRRLQRGDADPPRPGARS